MKSLLSKVKKSDIMTEPFPHIIVRDALDEDVYSHLVSEFPSINVISKGTENQGLNLSSSNTRFHHLAKETFSDEQISPIWKDFIALHTSATFFQEFINLFKESILHLYPNFEKEYGNLNKIEPGLRNVDTFATADVLLDALISINTPVLTKPTSVRQVHIDLPDKLFAGLFYMRDPQDESTGGNLEIYKFKSNSPHGFRNCESADRYVEHVKTIQYERNALVFFLNSLYSLHGVSVRSLTNSPRYFVNLVGEVKNPLFDISQYQEPPYIQRLRNIKKTVKKVALGV